MGAKRDSFLRSATRLGVVLALLVVALGVHGAQPFAEQAKLVAADGATDDFFGSAAALSQDTALVGAWGDDDLGRCAREQMQAEGVDCRFVKTVPDMATGVALILVDQRGENCISVASGANACLRPQDVLAVADQPWTQAGVLLACLEISLETVGAALDRACRTGLRTVLNPAPAPVSLHS